MDKELFEESSIGFGLKLFKLLLADASSYSNTIFSPFMLHSALTKLNIFASGKTAQEISTLLKYTSDLSKRDPARNYRNHLLLLTNDRQVKICERILINNRYNLTQSCRHIIDKYFGLDFGLFIINFNKQETAARKINTFIEGDTKHTVQNLVKNDTFATGCSIVMIQIMCIDVQWSKGFYPEETRILPFWVTKKDSVFVQMMHGRNEFNYAKLKDLNATALEFKLHKSAMNLLIILPNDKNGLKSVQNKMLGKGCANILTKISSKLEIKPVCVAFPKFEIDIEYLHLEKQLTKMGLETLTTEKANFADGQQGDPQPMQVTKILHKTILKFTEKGKLIPANPMLFDDKCPTFIVDHPFMYILKMKDTNLIVSMGSIQKIEEIKQSRAATLPRMGQPTPQTAMYHAFGSQLGLTPPMTPPQGSPFPIRHPMIGAPIPPGFQRPMPAPINSMNGFPMV